MTASAISHGASNAEESDSSHNKKVNDEQGPPDHLDRTVDSKLHQEKTPSAFLKIWTKLDLNTRTLLTMCKAALPPTIALSIYQADRVAQHFTTLGYLVAVISIIGFCIMPRAKFVQTMIMNLLAAGICSAFSLLMAWSAVKAREHTTPPRTLPQRYNSSQSTVLAVWLFFQVYVVNTIKARFPQTTFPTIVYSIFVNIVATNGFLFQTTQQVTAFIWKLLQAFLAGFAIATSVHFVVLPVSCRTVLMKEVTGYVSLLRASLGAHKAYVQSLEGDDMFGQTYFPEPKEGGRKKGKERETKIKPEIEAIKKTVGALQELHGKVAADIPFAKREIAYGKLTPDHLETMHKHLRAVFQPVLGLSSVIDLFERAAEINHWNGDKAEYDEESRKQAVREWNEVFQYLHEPLDNIFQVLDDALHHVLLKLDLTRSQENKKGNKKGADQDDIEAKGDATQPGNDNFSKHFEKQVDVFFNLKKPVLHHWMKSKGIKLQDDYSTTTRPLDEETLKKLPRITTHKKDQRQLYTLLYLMFLLNSVNRAVLGLVRFADSHDQAQAKSRLIWPGWRRFKKWAKSIFTGQDEKQEDETTFSVFDRSHATVCMGEAFKRKKDPEHLPPANAWEKFGDIVRHCAHFLSSPESSFGFRAACATMSIAIIAFLRQSQTFFVEQRLVWALIMVAISMTPTSGQAMFQFFLRLFGTFCATILAFLIWYIPDRHTAGILVFVFLFVALVFYVPIKRFDLTIVGIIAVVTTTLIIGYELQVRKIGVQASTRTGQPAYPVYELGPYRLATVIGGLAVAFFWTIFPFPITEHSALRQKLGGALYLSANLYSIMHEQIMARIRGDGGDEENDKESPGFALSKARNKVITKQMLVLQGLKMHAGFVGWEFPLGGKFPVEDYKTIIGLIEKILRYTALLGFASEPFTHPLLNKYTTPSALELDGAQSDSYQWSQDFRRIMGSAKVTSHEITSLLALLSSSVTNGQPLPPYLHAPFRYNLRKKLEAVDHDILSLRHIVEPGYAAFAVMAISMQCINMDMEKLLAAVKNLVGELDFSYHIISTGDSTQAAWSSSETLRERMVRKTLPRTKNVK